jgi:hypothetical protein
VLSAAENATGVRQHDAAVLVGGLGAEHEVQDA